MSCVCFDTFAHCLDVSNTASILLIYFFSKNKKSQLAVTRRDIVVKKRQPDGQEQGQSRGSGRFGPGGNGSQRSFGGAD